jgi:nucleoside-diphosphate-sugar epimerase
MTISDKRILVTGASGFLGLHLCRKLLGLGGELHAVCSSKPNVDGDRFQWHPADLADAECTHKMVADIRPEIVFHLCSYAQGERDLALVGPTFRGELQSSVNLLSSLAETGCRRLIMPGSLEEPAPGEIASSPYAVAKAASRAYAQMFHQLYDLPVVMTRIFMAYGPGQSTKKLIPHSIGCLLRGEPLKIASPERKVDWVYVEDVVDGLIAAATASGIEGKSLDIGSGQLVKVRDVIERIQRLTDPEAVVEFGALPSQGFEQVRCANAMATHSLTGWRPQISLDAGLARTVACHRQAAM